MPTLSPPHDPIYVRLIAHVENVDRQVVVHAERERGRVHYFEPALDRLAVADLGDELGVGICRGVGVIDAFHPVLGHQDRSGVDLQRPQGRRGIGGEKRVAGAGGEDHDPALLQVPHRTAADVGLGDLLDVYRRHHPGVLADLLQRVLERERIEHRRQHAHVVAGSAIHAGGGALQAPVDVAGADDNRHLDRTGADRGHLLGDPFDLRRVGAVITLPHQRLSRELQEDASELRLRLGQSPTRK